jgi:hypothetical protein
LPQDKPIFKSPEIATASPFGVLMRRTIALSLLLLFGWTLVAPLWARDAEANLPACCRRHGEHHCSMGALGGGQRALPIVHEKCPHSPASASAVHSPTFKPEAAELFYAEVVSHPARAPQTEALYRLSTLRSHQKRGPPSPLA